MGRTWTPRRAARCKLRPAVIIIKTFPPAPAHLTELPSDPLYSCQVSSQGWSRVLETRQERGQVAGLLELHQRPEGLHRPVPGESQA